MFSAGGNVIIWKSGLQHVVSLSTIQREYKALVEAVKEAIWLRGFSKEISFEQESVTMWCDSQSVMCLPKNSVYHERTKHISRKLYFIKDIIE